MRFAAWSYGYLLGVVPGLLALYLYGFTRKRQALAMFLEPALAAQLVPGLSRWRQWLKALCLIGAAGCLALALMQPQWGIRWQDMPSQGRHLMLALDVSRSMLAEDIAPNRLEYAKAAIRELVQVLQKEGGHRLGLVLFAGRADLHCPLTRDYAFFLQRLNDVGPQTILPGGTAIGHAIQQALQSFPSVDHPHKDLLLLTDGENHHSLPLEAAQTAAAQQVSLYILGLGDAETGSPIPVQDAQGRRTYLQYQGQEVRSRLNTPLLLEMARLTGGAYIRANTPATALARLYTEHIAPKARRPLDTTASEYLMHRYPWFVGAALLLLAAEMLLRERSARAAGEGVRGMHQRVGIALVIGLLLPVPGHTSSPYEAVQRGNALYQAGQYEAAAQQYATAAQALPEVAEVLFNQGAAAYKQQDYASALDYYTRALQTGDRRLAGRLQYNLGNVKYQQALAALHSAEDAITPLRAAMAYYRDSLDVDAQSQEARYNLELAYLLLRQLLPPRPQEQQNTQGQEQQTAQPQEQPQQQSQQQPSQQQPSQQPSQQQPSHSQPTAQTGQPQASLDNADTPLQPATELEELSPEEAERLLATIRERAREADIRRQQWRRAGRPRAEAGKDW